MTREIADGDRVDLPAADDGLAQPQGHVGHQHQCVVQRSATGMLWREAQILRLPIERVRDSPDRGRSIVVVGPKQLAAGKERMRADSLAFRQHVSGFRRPAQPAAQALEDESSVEKDCVPPRHGRKS